MPDRRIRIAADRAAFVTRLVESEESKGVFGLRADVLAFAAAVGAKFKRRRALGEVTKDPIRLGIFESRGYTPLIKILALCEEKDPNVLASTDGMEDKRAAIFEEYANGGLEVLEERLRGYADLQQGLLLLLDRERSDDGLSRQLPDHLSRLLES